MRMLDYRDVYSSFFYIENPFGPVFLGFKIYTYTGHVCRKAVSVFVAKNNPLLHRKGKLELHVPYT
jgi:hypothetical protein